MFASTVSQVHGDPDLMASDNWPYMRTAMTGSAVATSSPRSPDTETRRAAQSFCSHSQEQCSPPPAKFYPSQSNYNGDGPDQSVDGSYEKLVKSSMLPFSTLGVPKHVFKVRETTKLIMFLGVAIGGVLLLDLSAKLLISIAHNKCAQK
jgi:hypothetical protein